MSTYTAFEAQFLVAAYVLTEETGREYQNCGNVIDRYSLDPKPNWTQRALLSFKTQGLADDLLSSGDDRDQGISLTPAGIKEAERLLDEGRVTASLPDEEGNAQPSNPEPIINSSSWTGLSPDYRLPWERRDRLTKELIALERTIDNQDLTNSAKAQIRAHIMAARELSEAPDPPADLIWEILNRANQVAGISSLFISILALFH